MKEIYSPVRKTVLFCRKLTCGIEGFLFRFFFPQSEQNVFQIFPLGLRVLLRR